MSLETRVALHKKLSGATAVTKLLSSSSAIYESQAPAGAVYPLIILQKSAGVPVYAMKGEAFKRETWMVKAVDREQFSNRADAIADAIDETLNEGSLTLTGKTLADLRRIGDVDYVENSGDQTYQHKGGNYRLSLT